MQSGKRRTRAALTGLRLTDYLCHGHIAELATTLFLLSIMDSQETHLEISSYQLAKRANENSRS